MKTQQQLKPATIVLGLLFCACGMETSTEGGFAFDDFDIIQNWLLSVGKMQEVETWDNQDRAIVLIGDPAAITRRLSHIDPEFDAPPEDPYFPAEYPPPAMSIIAKKEVDAALSLVLEEFRDAEWDTDAPAPTFTKISNVEPGNTVVFSQIEIPIPVGAEWQEVAVALPHLPYDAEVEGYEVHISILKRGTGQAFIHSALLDD